MTGHRSRSTDLLAQNDQGETEMTDHPPMYVVVEFQSTDRVATRIHYVAPFDSPADAEEAAEFLRDIARSGGRREDRYEVFQLIRAGGAQVVDAHPWQEHNAFGNTCHHPGCRMTEEEHAEFLGRARGGIVRSDVTADNPGSLGSGCMFSDVARVFVLPDRTEEPK